MSLRARLLTVVVSLTAVGLVVASIVTYQQLRSFLVDRVDRTAEASAQARQHCRDPICMRIVQPLLRPPVALSR